MLDWALVAAGSIIDRYAVCVATCKQIKRTTIEIDQELLERAKAAVGEATTRGTVEEALRRLADHEDSIFGRRAADHVRDLERLARYADLAVLRSEEMWQ
jgi:Arc/MetJ family transcription regulator